MAAGGGEREFFIKSLQQQLPLLLRQLQHYATSIYVLRYLIYAPLSPVNWPLVMPSICSPFLPSSMI